MVQPPPSFAPGGNVVPTPAPQARIRGIRFYLLALATVYIIGSLGLGVVAFMSLQHNAHTIEQLQRSTEQLQRGSQQIQSQMLQQETDINDNLCSQQAYGIGSVCSGG